ncbi:YrdB family protein [Streptomyces sp. NPDC051771]|uniref:YrdB family protein n=1 Tax=Streptomyces sp. NPDC051771 TaxID=3154847 RepID=UPI00342EC4A9
MESLKGLYVVGDLVAFLVELVALGVLGWWGWSVADPVWLRIVLAVAVPGVTAVVWGMFAAPKARVRLPVAGVVGVKAVVFGAATAALVGVGHTGAAVVFGVVAAVDTAVVTVGRAGGGAHWGVE